MKKWLIVCWLVFVGTSSLAGEKIDLNQSQMRIVEQGVRNSLKDPSSAIFDWYHSAKDDDERIWVCGSINAKNSFGAYTGNQMYFGSFSEDKSRYVVIGIVDPVENKITPSIDDSFRQVECLKFVAKFVWPDEDFD